MTTAAARRANDRPDPDAVTRWGIERKAIYDRIAGLERKATLEGLGREEMAELNGLRRRIAETLCGWLELTGRNG